MSACRIASLLALGIAIIVALVACGGQTVRQGAKPASPMEDESDTVATSRLEAIIPPCVPYPGSSVDPCERRDSWMSLNPYVNASSELIQPAPTVQEIFLSFIDAESYTAAVQLVVRAIPIPGTTRCGTYRSFAGGIDFTEGVIHQIDLTRCYVDLAVNEYIVGSGPSRLSIDIDVTIPNYDATRLTRVAKVFGERFEGWEWTISLNGPLDPNNAAWVRLWHQDVQMREDGEVVVVFEAKADYVNGSLPEFKAINLERAELTLAEYRSQAKSAYERYSMETGGRIGAVNDVNGNPLPHLVQDASEDSIRKYISEIAVFDASEYNLSWPPSVPGENDPNPAGLTVNDIIATRVAGGVRIPGGLEGTATPVSALGDEPTATATAVAPHATVTAEGIATPEPVPTAVRKPN